MQKMGPDHQNLLGTLSVRGIASSKELQAATGKSQPTVSRLLADLSDRIVTLGHGRARRYGMPQAIRGLPAQQPIYWVDEAGQPSRLGTLTFLTNQQLHIEADTIDLVTQGTLPWFLTPLRAQGFLGRLLAQHLQSSGVDGDPDRWSLESILFGALNLHDAPGAIMIGEPLQAQQPSHAPLPSRTADLTRVLDDLSSDVARTLPAGSSAGGEQPKFLAMRKNGTHVLVKFTPPLGTPFGDRWHDLLHTEALALDVLARHGIGVARSTVVSSARRTYLLSERFDRIGTHGRRHVVAIGAAHAGFIATGYNNWSSSCEQLARQKRMSKADADTAAMLWHFGRLIGNTDMHSGNLGLLVARDGLAKGLFQLAPVYDMLAMRWRPDPSYGGAADYSPFEPDMISTASAARPLAQVYWRDLASHDGISAALRKVAGVMAERLNARET